MAYSGSQKTRLGLYGGTRGLYGSFAGKVENENSAGPHNPGEITRLGLAAIPRGLYGDFSGKAEAIPEPEPEVAPAGGSKRRRYKGYPRRVLINGKQYWVKSAEEERRLLEQWRQELLAEEPEKPLELKRARVTIKRIERRIIEADDREADWNAFLMAEDEELLVLMFG